MAVCSSLGFIALPGGYGVSLEVFPIASSPSNIDDKKSISQTFEEVMEMVTWTQLRIRE